MERRYLDDLHMAHQLADLADSITMQRFRASDLRVDAKADHTPVTDADTLTEQRLRAMLAKVRRRDAIVGEEGGGSVADGRSWIIDPIDGTKNYMRGVPVWATLIGLAEGGQMVVGVVSAPALKRRWWAARGLGAFTGTQRNPRQIHVSRIADINQASLSYSSLTGWAQRGTLPGFMALAQTVWRTRGYGDFWSHMLVAEGAVDIAAEPELELYDMAALVPIVTEAGGTFTSLEGEDGCWGSSGISSNGLLHAEALAALNSKTGLA